MRRIGLVAVALAVGALVASPAAAMAHGGSGGHDGPTPHLDGRAVAQLVGARAATRQYRHAHPGYDLLRDAAGISCVDQPGEGGMGVHYVNGALVGDGKVNAETPDVLVYEPRADGRERLVALEYVVFQADWDATHSSPPRLFGQEFELATADNRYGLPPFYELHVWLWKFNPSGLFDDWNPRVHCPAA